MIVGVFVPNCAESRAAVFNQHLVPAMILGGDGKDHLDGGSGDDVIVVGDGNDKIFGRGGDDILIGGDGRDDIKGGDGEDIVIGGFTVHDHDLSALDNIFEEWTANASYLDRINALSNGTGLTGISLTAGVDVFDDGDKDKLDGGKGLDWYFGDDDGNDGDDDKIKIKVGEVFDQIPDWPTA